MAQTNTDFISASEALAALQQAHCQKEASWILAGVAVLSDWLGSNNEYFSFNDKPMDLSDYWHNHALPSAENAIANSGILPVLPEIGLTLESLFPFIKEPTPLQTSCENLHIPLEPQLFILEDVTGPEKPKRH